MLVRASEAEDEGAGELWSVDRAIHYAIHRCGSEDAKKRMYSSILLTGAGHSFKGFAATLQSWCVSAPVAALLRAKTLALTRLALPCSVKASMPTVSGPLVSSVQVLSNPKDLKPEVVCWKGASILARLDQADDFWIEHDEWQERGVGLLRDVLPFPW